MVTYPGGKAGSGVYQTIINHMPPHDVYIEPFLGNGAIMRLKRPARHSIGIDIDPTVQALWTDFRTENIAEFITGDGIKFLKQYAFTGGELVYCDPPYLHSTRSKLKLYNFEMSDQDHVRLLEAIKALPCYVMVSGYGSDLYKGILSDWNCITFEAMTRGGTKRTEWLWFNFPAPEVLHDYSYLGKNYRERERIKKKAWRWLNKLEQMSGAERMAIITAISERYS